jgi:hypothetical protein
MADSVKAGAATVQDLPDGAVVTFPDGWPATAANPRADRVEALLEPDLLHIGIVPPAGLPPYKVHRRVQAWGAHFRRMLIGQALQPAPNDMTVSLQAVCPDRPNGWGYNDGSRSPACF